ncbi:predicted protein [Naegleria gruberi]|uniref:Predicted protein n=1 Tax=Naegleria gruberi TaxID=5762 RepID=D2VJT3_NAEGR|nr:uncharacterized protein NAEGRDRAFT_50129 [Naegleria gruberi]EFC43087.1 predicted protein [Naegleria gruberi]|eukprot:XP_002675831.1 predicted protein [Naegleria gruberi strain NEG-M]
MQITQSQQDSFQPSLEQQVDSLKKEVSFLYSVIRGEVLVSFDVVINSFANKYCSMIISMGDLSDSSKWVFTFYLFGKDSDKKPGVVGVYGNINGKLIALTNDSEPLRLNEKHHIEWRYNKHHGSILTVNGNVVGSVKAYQGNLEYSRSDKISIGKIIYNGGGRQHSQLDGLVSNLSVIANGKIHD